MTSPLSVIKVFFSCGANSMCDNYRYHSSGCIFFKRRLKYQLYFIKEFGNFDHGYSSKKYLKGKKFYKYVSIKNSPFVKNYYDTGMKETKQRHVGYVTLLGRPSAGKSSFINAVIDDKISIVSSIPQTTRRLIRGIHTNDMYQIIFQDVPGLHSSAHHWNQSINWVTKNALNDTDIILRVIDGSRAKGEEELIIDRIVSEAKVPVITIVTKSDLLSEKDKKRFPKEAIFVSNITHEGIDEVTKAVGEKLPTGPLLYPESDITDQDVYTRVSEIIREKVFQTTYEEVPHHTYVEVETMEDKGKLVKILAYIFCTSESQKKILVGNHGSKIKDIGTLARRDLQDLFEKKVYLELHVKVSENWQDRENITRKVLGKM